MQTKRIIRIILAIVFSLIGGKGQLTGQIVRSITLENAVDLALQNNHLLNVRKLQVNEKQMKVNEDRIKYLPSVIVGGSYLYNSGLPSLTFEQGRFGTLPLGPILIPLPAMDEVIVMGNHNIYNAGITLYQPVAQIGKISAGVKVSRTELQIAQTEESKAAYQVRQAVEKLYFGLLILQKQVEEAGIKVELAKSRLSNIENAVSAGKTTESNRYGLSAGAADEEQNLLKLKIQYDDYTDDLRQLTGLGHDETYILAPVPDEELSENLPSIDTSMIVAGTNNNDLKVASLNKTKADYSVLASKLSYLPDLGILGGYTYQHGSVIYPEYNTFIGASLKWNLQDILSNRTVQQQRNYLRKQAEENLLNTREQVNKDIAKILRKLRQSEELIKVAKKVVEYRGEDLKIQRDRFASGLNLETDRLAAEAAMAKAESDLYAARLNYRIVLSELKILTGDY